jgi:hypothetical protein
MEALPCSGKANLAANASSPLHGNFLCIKARQQTSEWR